ncbi:MAG: ABC transporter permease [Oscillospiraceae bacterium]|nr:ABC transporter permease [Oscillospiraceae bacterium]
MKKRNFKNAGTVFRYTLSQHYKNKSVIIFLLFLFLLALAVFPFVKWQSGKESDDISTVKSIYLCNETAYPLELSLENDKGIYADAGITFIESGETAIADALNQDKDGIASVISVDETYGCLAIRSYYSETGNMGQSDASSVNEWLKDVLHDTIMLTADVTEEQETLLNTPSYSSVAKVADYQNGSQESTTGTHMVINYIYSYLIIILSTLSMGYIFQLCMDEKSSKLVESMIVSIQPEALLFGKILAVSIFIFLGIGIVALGLFLSYQISGIGSELKEIMQSSSSFFSEIKLPELNLQASVWPIIILCVVLAYLITLLLSGIVGSCCSKQEDVQTVSWIVVAFLLLGFIANAFIPLLESDIANHVISLLPLTSIFAAVPNYLCGKIGMPVLVISIVLQIGFAVFLAWLSGIVYKAMLLYRGQVPKPGQLIGMLREHYASEKAAAGKEQ